MALTDLFNIVDHSISAGQNMVNVYQVRELLAGQSALKIALVYRDWILPLILPLQHPDVEHTQITVENLGDPTKFITLALSGQVGTRLGTLAPTSLAFEIRFPRTTKAIRDGFKRWGGLSEETFTSQDLAPAFITDMDSLGFQMVNPWEDPVVPGIDVCEFVIIKRVCTTQPPPDPCPGYRLPVPPEVEELYVPITSQSKTTVRTQVSRRVPAS